MRESVPILNQVNLVVRDMTSSIEFYRRLGLPVVEAAHPEWARHHASVVLPNGVSLELDSAVFAKQWNPGLQSTQAGGAVLFFGVASREEVDRIFETMMRHGYACQKSPEDAFWGARYAIISDPDRYAVGIMSPIDLAFRHAPPEPPR